MHVVKIQSNFTGMYARSLILPDYSFFLFGPRATGKTTWLREKLPDALWKNLLLDEDYLPLLGDSSLLRQQVEARPTGSWIVIDEVQRIPAILNSVHDIISRHGDDYRFAMSGSSARKLRRLDVNLLAGRAIERRMFPLTSQELGDDFSLEQALKFGTLPPVVQRPDYASDILTAYVSTYLKQEIQQEALIENLGNFHRFLRICGLVNGEIVNVSAISRDAGIARMTAQRYFDVLVDTLIAFRLPGWQPRLKVREQSSPKYYFFDPGVVRALTGRVQDPLTSLEAGKLFETLILNELRSAVAYQNLGGQLGYWRSSSGAEVDFIWTRGDRSIAIEVKSNDRWRYGAGKVLNKFAASRSAIRCYGVYRGSEPLRDKDVIVLPYQEFLRKLHAGAILN